MHYGVYYLMACILGCEGDTDELRGETINAGTVAHYLDPDYWDWCRLGLNTAATGC